MWAQHPDEVKAEHSECLTPLEDAKNKTMMSPETADQLLCDPGTFEDFSDILNDGLDSRTKRAENSHCNFVTEEINRQKNVPKPAMMADETCKKCQELKWPAFDSNVIRKHFKMPTGKTCQKMFHVACEAIEPCLLRDIFLVSLEESFSWMALLMQ